MGHNQCGQMIKYKVTQNFQKVAQKVATAVFTWLVVYFKITQKVTNFLGNSCTKNGSREIKKIAQPGHTGHNPPAEDVSNVIKFC